MGVSDRYFIAHFGELSEVGVYSVGYKFGTVLQILVVTPFQLAWPAFAFSISEAADHRFVYARTLTYLSAISVFGWLVLSELTEPLLRIMVHQAYVSAYKVVPMVAAAYVFNGIHFCVSPGIHIKGIDNLVIDSPVEKKSSASFSKGPCKAALDLWITDGTRNDRRMGDGSV